MVVSTVEEMLSASGFFSLLVVEEDATPDCDPVTLLPSVLFTSNFIYGSSITWI